MQKFPHHYHAQAHGRPTGSLDIQSGELTKLDIAAPKEFDGPGDKWSPEDLLVASVASCLILTFRAIATASKLEWSELSCDVEGILEMVDRKTKFTEIHINASLKVKSQEDEKKAAQILEKAENNCLITNTLTSEKHLKTNITTA